MKWRWLCMDCSVVLVSRLLVRDTRGGGKIFKWTVLVNIGILLSGRVGCRYDEDFATQAAAVTMTFPPRWLSAKRNPNPEKGPGYPTLCFSVADPR
jgi:hypothetical protein